MLAGTVPMSAAGLAWGEREPARVTRVALSMGAVMRGCRGVVWRARGWAEAAVRVRAKMAAAASAEGMVLIEERSIDTFGDNCFQTTEVQKTRIWRRGFPALRRRWIDRFRLQRGGWARFCGWNGRVGWFPDLGLGGVWGSWECEGSWGYALEDDGEGQATAKCKVGLSTAKSHERGAKRKNKQRRRR